MIAGIDPSARIEPGAKIGRNVTIGPYCTIGPHVTVGDDCRLIAHVNLTGHTTVGARTVIHPFASLGSSPQSSSYRGGPTTLVVGEACDIRENVTMSTGTEDGGGQTQVGDGCFFMVGSHVGHDCRVGNKVVFANNTVLGGHCTIGDNVVFGGGVAVRQFVRIGEGAMIVGLSGVRATYQALFFGTGEFRARLDRVEAEHGADALVATMIAFIRAGKRPLTMAVNRAEADEDL